MTSSNFTPGDVVRFASIIWDLDGERVDLPTEDIFTLPFDWPGDDGVLADLLSDRHGFAVDSFTVELATS